MKLPKIVVFGLSMTILSCEALPTLARSQQYTVNSKLQQSIPELPNTVKNDSRSQGSEKLNETWIERKYFTSALAKIDSTLTPFLGRSNSFENNKTVNYSSDKLPTLAKNTRFQALPSQKLVNAIRKAVSANSYSQVSYSFVEIDLNGDRVKEAIVHESGPHCNSHCYPKVFTKVGNQYKLVGEHLLYNAKSKYKVAILKRTNAGWANIAKPAYNKKGINYEMIGWQILKFNGKEYNEGVTLKSIKSRLIIDFEKTERFSLASSGSSKI